MPAKSSYTSAHWGVYQVDVEAGGPTIRALDGDPDPSAIGLHMASPALQKVRVARPAIRRSWLDHGPGSNTQLRGHEPFVEVEWDRALDLVAGEVARVARDHGNQSIFGGSYGWASAGRFHHAQSQLHRFLNMMGGYTSHVDNYSLGAGRVILPHVVASTEILLDQHSSWEVLEEHTALFVAFGGVPVKNAQMSAGGAGRHRVAAAMRRMCERKTRFVNISPVSDNIPVDSEWIPIRPNTDVALMLGMAFTLIAEGLADRHFLASHCVGFERFERYVDGTADGVAKTPAWAARITGVDAARIAALARQMAAVRTMLNISWSLQRAVHGEQPFWMLVTLAAMLGQIGLAGGGFGIGYGALNSVGHANVKFKAGAFPQGTNPVSSFIPVARIADMLLKPGETFTYNGKTHTYPDIRMVYWAGGNPYHHHQDLNRLLRAWQKPETIIVNEPYWTPTAKLADIVLPVTTPLERNDIGASGGEDLIVAMTKVCDPFGQSRDDFAIFSELGRRLGIDFDEGLDERQWLDRIYAITRENAAAKQVAMPDFASFWDQGIFDLQPMKKPIILLEDFRRDPASFPVPTPSGKIEIYSQTLAAFALQDCPAHPTWFQPPEWLGSNHRPQASLHLISDQPIRRLHSQLDASPHSRASKINGHEPVNINPHDAAARGIEDNDLVEIHNNRGSCVAAACLTDAVMPGVVRLSTGAWFDPDWSTGFEKHGNPNAVTLDQGASSLSQGCSAQTCLVEIRRFTGPSEVTAFDPPVLNSL